jgi:hypothetical protein
MTTVAGQLWLKRDDRTARTSLGRKVRRTIVGQLRQDIQGRIVGTVQSGQVGLTDKAGQVSPDRAGRTGWPTSTSSPILTLPAPLKLKCNAVLNVTKSLPRSGSHTPLQLIYCGTNVVSRYMSKLEDYVHDLVHVHFWVHVHVRVRLRVRVCVLCLCRNVTKSLIL